MRALRLKLVGGLAGLIACTCPTPCTYAVNGNALALRSSGSAQGSSWLLSDNGYVGTYVTLTSAGNVTVSVNASGQAFGGVAPRMNIAVADSVASFDVAATAGTYQHTISLPAGTHFIRTDFNNDPEKSSRALTVANLNVSGATVTNANTDVNALAAADTYIANSRRGPASLSLVGVEPGAQVHVALKRHDFRFGTAVGGSSLSGVNAFLNNANYSNFLRGHFNTITQGNAGKWASNEATRDVVTMAAVDRIFSYAEQHGLDVRMHNMLWADSQQPSWATTLLNTAVGTDAAAAAAAKADLRAEISERIRYYVGDGDADRNDGDRAERYVELDVLNEHVHQPKYWSAYGAAGIAQIFLETNAVLGKTDSTAGLYLNEYNVLQYGADGYGNWYREDVEELNSAVIGAAVTGIGVQYYPFHVADSNAPSAARIQQIYQNLSVTGLPISLTEFGVQPDNGTTVAQAATYMTEAMRMTYGTPNATTFMMWGFATNDVWDQAPLAALMNTDGSLTSVGVAYEQLMSQWDTDVTLPVAADGTIDFNGFYGDYEVTVDGKTYALDLAKGTTDYQLVIKLAADFDNDGSVDADDLAVWRTQQALGGSGGDADGDLDTDGDDYLLWQRQLGLSEAAPVAVAPLAAVPEPAAAVLLALASLGVMRRRSATSH
jgi:GH35 family endo-1,4-beta-xylanase